MAIGTKNHIEERNIKHAISYVRILQGCLGRYAELLGMEIPPEEEVPAEPPAVEEPVEEGTLLVTLGLPPTETDGSFGRTNESSVLYF